MSATRTPARRTPPAVRRALYGLTLVLAVISVVWGAIALLDLAARDDERTTRDLGTVARVELDTDSGDVEVRAGSGDTAVLETIERRGLFGGPDVTVRTEGERLVVRSSCTAVLSTSCGVRHVLRVPSGTPVDLRTGSGDITVDGVRSQATLESGSGDIELSGATGPAMQARTGSGDIELEDVRARSVELRTGSGDIDLEAAAPPDELVARTGSGDIDLVLPRAVYQVSSRTGSGDQDVQIPQDPQATRRLDVETGSGDISARQR